MAMLLINSKINCKITSYNVKLKIRSIKINIKGVTKWK